MKLCLGRDRKLMRAGREMLPGWSVALRDINWGQVGDFCGEGGGCAERDGVNVVSVNKTGEECVVGRF